MFLSLFVKECKQVSRSLVYYIFLFIFILFMVSQLGATEIVQKPEPNQENYGTKCSQDKEEIMGSILTELVESIDLNTFATYPAGFYKEVIVSDDELEKMKNIVEECTGKNWNTLMKERGNHENQVDSEMNVGSFEEQIGNYVLPDSGLSYNTFQQKMEEVCQIIGKGSAFEKKRYSVGVLVPMTYEDALEEYHEITEKDGITGAYMRLFCDYAVIVLSLITIFMGVTRCVRDKRAKVEQVIYARKAKSYRIILSRYLANVVMMFVPIVILAFILEAPYLYQAQTVGVIPHSLAFLGYSIMWLLPTILFVLALSFLLTELFNGIVAIVIQVFMGIAYLMTATTLVGNFGWNLVPRWNTFGKTLQYMNERTVLYQNRLLYTGLAILFMVLTIGIYECKRQGGMHFYEKKH